MRIKRRVSAAIGAAAPIGIAADATPATFEEKR